MRDWSLRGYVGDLYCLKRRETLGHLRYEMTWNSQMRDTDWKLSETVYSCTDFPNHLCGDLTLEDPSAFLDHLRLSRLAELQPHFLQLENRLAIGKFTPWDCLYSIG